MDKTIFNLDDNASVSEVLSMPTRIGRPKTTEDDDNESLNSSFRDTIATNDDGDDYISTLLTSEEDAALTDTERATWKAKYNDLSERRKEFRGAVTYAYDGVFSWSMYSSAEARDSNNSLYTEYLMRLQWGPDWNSMQPWIVARRFREFVALDADVRAVYNSSNEARRSNIKLSEVLPSLPSRFTNLNLFGNDNLDANIVEQRTAKLEEYMSTIVTSLPNLLKSKPIDKFLGVSERIAHIRKQLADEAAARGKGAALATGFDYGQKGEEIGSKNTLAPGMTAQLKSENDDQIQEFTTIEAAEKLSIKLLNSEKADLVLTSGVAEILPLDDEQLSSMEEDLMSLANMQRQYSARKYLIACKVHTILETNNLRWPALKRTCRFDETENGLNVVAKPMERLHVHAWGRRLKSG